MKKIFTRDEALQIVEMFEYVLAFYNIKVPSTEDDEREPDDIGLYGSTYSFLLDNVESRLIDLLVSHTPDTEIVTDAFSGTIWMIILIKRSFYYD